MAAFITLLLTPRGPAFRHLPRGTPAPLALLLLPKDLACRTVTTAAAATSTYHTRLSCWGGQGMGVAGLPRSPIQPLPRPPVSSRLLTRTPVTSSPPLLNLPVTAVPTQRHMSSFSDAIRNILSVGASSPQAEDVAGSVDAAAIPPPPPVPPSSAVDAVEYIPLPPSPPEAVSHTLNALGEPTLLSLGLGGWTPIGIIQSGLEALHVSCDLPWWGAIAITTVILRTLIFPLVVTSQRNAAKMNNHMPQMQVLQMKMTEARNAGDQLNAARYSQEMVVFMKEKNLSPMRNVLVPLAQAPIFISMFIGLRRMANLPMESLSQGGLWWFMDLTTPDPYYLLPIITSITMLATIELGTDGARLSSQNMHYMKYVLRALPLFIFPFTINFPSAVLCYWVSTNFFSLVQVGFLRIPAVRKYFRIDKLITHAPESLPAKKKKKGVVRDFKDSWRNMKITKEIEERQRYDEIMFKKAGSGPIVRTYKHNPTKKAISVQAKSEGK